MFGRFKDFYRRHARIFAAVFTAAIILIWLLGPALFEIFSLGQSFLVSFGILAIILSSIQDFLNDLGKSPRSVIHEDQTDNNRQLISALNGVKVDHVKMIEYDSESVKALIFFFLQAGAEVHCLLQHPDFAINESQRRRTVLQVMTVNEEYSGYLNRIKFSYYRDLASLRGRKVDERLLSIGWYSYDRRPGVIGRQVWGHSNPVITATLDNPQGVRLASFFDTVFDNLLRNSESWEDIATQYELHVIRRGDSRVTERLQYQLGLRPGAMRQRRPTPSAIVLSIAALPDIPSTFAAEALPLLSPAFDDRQWDIEAVSSLVLTEATCRLLITARAEADDSLVGFVAIHDTDNPNQAKLHWLVVDHAWRGQGIGRALVETACQAAMERGSRSIMLRTEVFRVAAIALYQSLGFYEVPCGDADVRSSA